MNLLLISFIHFNVAALYNCWSQAVCWRLSPLTLPKNHCSCMEREGNGSIMKLCLCTMTSDMFKLSFVSLLSFLFLTRRKRRSRRCCEKNRVVMSADLVTYIASSLFHCLFSSYWKDFFCPGIFFNYCWLCDRQRAFRSTIDRRDRHVLCGSSSARARKIAN